MSSGPRSVLRAAAVAASATGLAVLLLNPPELSGAGDLIVIAAVALAIVLVTAWGTVVAMGDSAAGQAQFERIVQRTEALAASRGTATPASHSDFEQIIAEAIDELPEEFRTLLEKVPVVVSDDGAEVHAYGRYYGDTVARDRYEDRIVIYRDTLERDFGWDPDLLRAQVVQTLRHELAHHLGWNEDGVRNLGL